MATFGCYCLLLYNGCGAYGGTLVFHPSCVSIQWHRRPIGLELNGHTILRIFGTIFVVYLRFNTVTFLIPHENSVSHVHRIA